MLCMEHVLNMHGMCELQTPMCSDIEQGKSADKDSADLTCAERLSMALSFYDLQHTHVIHEKDPDTKVSSLGHAQGLPQGLQEWSDVIHFDFSQN